MARERVVIDTNVFVNGLLSAESTPAPCIQRAVEVDQLVASEATLRELFTTLLSSRFDRYVSRERRDALLFRLAPIVEVVPMVQEIRECRDPKDDKFLEAAVNGRAGIVVSGDRGLPAPRGETLASHRGRRCIAGRMQPAFHHGAG